MTILQTRIFVKFDVPLNHWYETLLGYLIKPIVNEFRENLSWFWYSRYLQHIGDPNEDRDDCNLELLPEIYKLPNSFVEKPFHRSIRFRFEIDDDYESSFTTKLRKAIIEFCYAVSDIRDFDPITDLGGDRFCNDRMSLDQRSLRADYITQYLYYISQIYLDTLIGPNSEGYFYTEFESTNNIFNTPIGVLHHLFCNITQYPEVVYCNQ
jgi:hypothetical protein